MSKVVFLSNVDRRFAMMKVALQQLQQENLLSNDSVCVKLSDNTVWNDEWQKLLEDADILLLKWMGAGLDTHFFKKLLPFIKKHQLRYYIDAAGTEEEELVSGIEKNDLEKFKASIETQVHEMKGRVVIPSFAQSRLQQLVLMIYEMYKDSQWKPKVYIDSPLSIKIFDDYEECLTGEDKKLFDEMIQDKMFTFVKESEDSKALVQSNEPCVILSTSGMCMVGRIRHHLKKCIPNPNATMLFVGFSTDGSLASLLKDNKRKSVTIDQKEYPCRCASYSLKSMSGHAPFWQLIDNYTKINSQKIVLHHGSKQAKETLKIALEKELEKQCKSTRVVIANSSLKFTL